MTCREVTGAISDFVDGELGVSENAALEAHLAACPSCRRYLTGYRATIAAVKNAYADDEPSPERVRALVDRILSSVGPNRKRAH